MKKYLLALVFILSSQTGNAVVSPIQAMYLNVFPGVTNASLEAFVDGVNGPWYVTFNLVAPANVVLGAFALPVSSPFVECCFTVTSARLTTIDGANVAFGTNNFTQNPFTSPINWLVVAEGLQPGAYALEVSGFGNRDTQRLGNRTSATDFATRLTVSAVPEPESYVLMLAGIGLIGFAIRTRIRL